MNDQHLIAIDAGVSFVKVGVYDSEGGRLALASRGAPAEQPRPGTFIQDADQLYDLARDALREAVAASGVRPGSVAAIAVSGAMGGAMGVDAHWQPVTDWSIVSDTRFMPHAVAMQEGAHEEILARSGTNLPIMGAKSLWWKKDHPDAVRPDREVRRHRRLHRREAGRDPHRGRVHRQDLPQFHGHRGPRARLVGRRHLRPVRHRQGAAAPDRRIARRGGQAPAGDGHGVRPAGGHPHRGRRRRQAGRNAGRRACHPGPSRRRVGLLRRAEPVRGPLRRRRGPQDPGESPLAPAGALSCPASSSTARASPTRGLPTPSAPRRSARGRRAAAARTTSWRRRRRPCPRAAKA